MTSEEIHCALFPPSVAKTALYSLVLPLKIEAASLGFNFELQLQLPLSTRRAFGLCNFKLHRLASNVKTKRRAKNFRNVKRLNKEYVLQ